MENLSPNLIHTLAWLGGVLIIFGLFASLVFSVVSLRKRLAAAVKDSQGEAFLAEHKNRLNQEIQAIENWLEKAKDEVLKISGERQKQELVRAELRQHEEVLAAKRGEVENIVNKVTELEAKGSAARKNLDRLLEEIGNLEKKEARAQELDDKISEAKAQLEQYNRLASLKESLTSDCQSLTAKLDKLKEDLESQNEKQKETDGLNARLLELQVKLEAEKQKLDTLKKEEQASQDHKTEILSATSTLEAKRDALENDCKSLADKLGKLKDDLEAHTQKQKANEQLNDKLLELQIQLEAQKEKLDDLKKEEKTSQDRRAEILSSNAALEAKKDMLEEEITGLTEQISELRQKRNEALQASSPAQSFIGAPSPGASSSSFSGGEGGFLRPESYESPDAYSDLLESAPVCLDVNEFSDSRTETDEAELLWDFRQKLSASGIFFPPRVIDAFHTSLKCQDISPLTVLAGVSGTGKTLLPVRYAEYMGIYRHILPVQPRWDSPQDLFGFYNYLEKKFKATELSRSLLRMDPYNYPDQFAEYEKARDSLFLVLLDEMNLARTEYYFSEFLSRLELRRTVSNPEVPNQRHIAELELDVGPRRGDEKGFRIWIPRNILFVGTMNEDESTQTLSDKVLDRSNVMRFGKPENAPASEMSFSPFQKSEKYLPAQTWNSWLKLAETAPEQTELNSWIDSLNEAMDSVGRPFGYRVRSAITTYVANYPATEEEERYKLAFADQIEQKILPKLRGLDMNSAQNALTRVQDVIRQTGDQELEEAFNRAQQDSQEQGLFLWRGVTRANAED